MSQFRFDQVAAAKKTIASDQAWMALEGRAYGTESGYPLKVLVTTAPEKWAAGWNSGNQKYAAKLNPAGKRRFAEQCQNMATMPREAFMRATRNAIAESECLLGVAWVGPIFETEEELDAWISGDLKISSGDEDVNPPKGIREAFTLDKDFGTWSVPITHDPPEDWMATPDQIERLLAFDDFCIQVGGCRRILEEEGQDPEDDSAKNSETGPTTRRGGKPSRKTSAPA